jgi:hypothetical protein
LLQCLLTPAASGWSKPVEQSSSQDRFGRESKALRLLGGCERLPAKGPGPDRSQPLTRIIHLSRFDNLLTTQLHYLVPLRSRKVSVTQASNAL